MTTKGFILKIAGAASAGLALIAVPVSGQTTNPSATPPIQNLKEKVSYGVGMTFGNQIKRAGFDVDLEVVAAAMRDTMAGKETKYTDAQVREAIMAYQQELRAKHEAERQQIAEKNKREGDKFLAENKTKPGVKTQTVTLRDGNTAELQYKVLAQGTGASPKATDIVTVNYRGTFIDGKEFDSSAKHGAPLKRPANSLVPGWVEALQMMKTGSKWQLFLPPSLAYGEAGGPGIEPGSTLVFEVELVAVETPVPPPSPASGAAGAAPLTSDIIKVPSAEEMKKGAKIEVIKAEDAARMSEQQQQPEKK
jgi:FKBP-type peptidyl-prolyl cis-trans isomerase FklB